MAVSIRASAVKSVSVSRTQPKARVQRPVVSNGMKLAGAGLATIALTAAVVAPVEAANVVSTIASASEGYPFVPPSWAPAVLIPFTAWFIPGVAMASLFNYIEKDAPQ